MRARNEGTRNSKMITFLFFYVFMFFGDFTLVTGNISYLFTYEFIDKKINIARRQKRQVGDGTGLGLGGHVSGGKWVWWLSGVVNR